MASEELTKQTQDLIAVLRDASKDDPDAKIALLHAETAERWLTKTTVEPEPSEPVITRFRAVIELHGPDGTESPPTSEITKGIRLGLEKLGLASIKVTAESALGEV